MSPLLCKIGVQVHSRPLGVHKTRSLLYKGHSFTAASSQHEPALLLKWYGYDLCFCLVPCIPLDIFKSYLYMLDAVRELVQVKCCSLLPGCSWPGSDPHTSGEQQQRHQQWDKEGGGQSARGNGTSAFSSSTGLCWFKMTVKLWKNFQCLQCWVIVTEEITQSSNLFFLLKASFIWSHWCHCEE